MSFFVKANMHDMDAPYLWGPFSTESQAGMILLALAGNAACDGAVIFTGEQLEITARRMWRARWLKYRMDEKADRPDRDFYFCWDFNEPA